MLRKADLPVGAFGMQVPWWAGCFTCLDPSSAQRKGPGLSSLFLPLQLDLMTVSPKLSPSPLAIQADLLPFNPQRSCAQLGLRWCREPPGLCSCSSSFGPSGCVCASDLNAPLHLSARLRPRLLSPKSQHRLRVGAFLTIVPDVPLLPDS